MASRLDKIEAAVNDLLEAKGRDPMPPSGNSGRWWFGVALLLASLGIISMITALVNGQQIMEPSKLAAVRASLPQLLDDEAHDKLHDPQLVLYDEQEIPQAYQHQAGSGHSATTFHSPLYNISADPSDQPLGRGRRGGGNANLELPWSLAPGGAHNAVGVRSVKGFKFPAPVIVFRRSLPGRVGTGNVSQTLDWVFAEGSLFVELLYQRIGDQDVVFELRTRQKEGREWAVDVFRPFATSDELADAIEELGPGKYREEAIAALRRKETLPVARLVDSVHTRERAINRISEIANLPHMLTQDVLQLLDRPFQSVAGMKWKGDADAPSNESEYVNLVPPNYHGTFVGSDRVSCMGCHDSAGRHATEFQDRGWYGRVRGSFSEGILSWHPVEPSSIAYNGSHIPVRLRQQFVSAGWVQMLQGSQLPAGYQFTDKGD